MEYRTGVFRVELDSDVPSAGRYFDYLHETALGVGSGAEHAGFLEVFAVGCPEFVAVTVAFVYEFPAVGLIYLGARSEGAGIGSEPHRPAHHGDALLLFHQFDDRMRGLRVHLGAVGVFHPEDVAGVFNHHHLHAQAYAEGDLVVGPAPAGGDDLAFYASLSEARAYDDSVHGGEFLPYVLFCNVFTLDEVGLDAAVVVCT